jgi:PAS domain S-box-containing protein
MFGYRENELIGQSISILIPQRFRKAHESGMARVAASGKARLINETVELFGITKDGSEFPVELSLSNWKSRNHTFYNGITRDISERRGTSWSVRRLSNVSKDLLPRSEN